MNTVRTFVAVEPGGDVRARAGQLIGRLKEAEARIKWVEPHNLHWSLKFLGDVDLREIPQVCEAIARSVADLPAFEVEAHGAGAFPDARRPRTVWLGVGRGAEAMVALHERIERALAPLGFRREGRRFRPHLTLGRVREGGQGMAELARLLAEQTDFAAGAMEVDEVVVFSSTLDRTGPTYEALATCPLGG
jgi:2'-5' RNA ligase